MNCAMCPWGNFCRRAWILVLLLTACALCVFLASCTTQIENMHKGPGGVSSYTYVLNKIGGQAAAESSSGTKLVVNDENSFTVFCQTMGFAVAGWTQASVTKAKEVSAQLAAKEITKRQAQEQMAALQKAELASKGSAVETAGAHGAEFLPVKVNAP